MIHPALLLASSSDTATGVGIPVALAAGLVSFLSPCVLPLVPGYLSTVIGVTPTDLKEGVGARRVLKPSLLFIASFSAIFILLGLSATVIGSSLRTHKELLTQVGRRADHPDGARLPGDALREHAQQASGTRSRCCAWPAAAVRSSQGRPSRSPGPPARASRWERSSPRRPSRAPPPTGLCCWPSTRSAWRSPSWRSLWHSSG